jgi:hypothetical protein
LCERRANKGVPEKKLSDSVSTIHKGMHLMGGHLMDGHLMGKHLICIDFEFLIFKIVSGKDDLYLAVAFGWSWPGIAFLILGFWAELCIPHLTNSTVVHTDNYINSGQFRTHSEALLINIIQLAQEGPFLNTTPSRKKCKTMP